MRLIVLLLVVFAGSSAAAQMLPTGTWTGTWEAGSRQDEATALIERCETGLRVRLRVGAREAMTEKGTWEAGRLRFTTDRARLPGMPVARELSCTLSRSDDGQLSGTCRHGLRRYRLSLAPPAAGTIGCDS